MTFYRFEFYLHPCRSIDRLLSLVSWMLNSFVFVSSGWIVFFCTLSKSKRLVRVCQPGRWMFLLSLLESWRFQFCLILCWILTINVSWRAGCWIALSLSQVAELFISIPTLTKARGRFESVNPADGCFCSVFWRVERFSSFLVYVEFSLLMSPGELDVK